VQVLRPTIAGPRAPIPSGAVLCAGDHDAGELPRSERHQHAASHGYPVPQRERQLVGEGLVHRNRQTDVAVQRIFGLGSERAGKRQTFVCLDCIVPSRNPGIIAPMKAVALALVLVSVACADDLSDTFDALKRAEAARSAADVYKYATETSRLARIQIGRRLRRRLATTTRRIARSILVRLTRTPNTAWPWRRVTPNSAPSVIAQLVDAIVAQNPKSEYLALAVPPYLESVPQPLDAAEKILKLQPDNEDALLALTDGNLRNQQFHAAEGYASELLAVMSGKARPERYSVEAWRDKKAQLSVHVHFNAGVAACSQQAWQTCDAHFRAIGSETAIAGAVNFYLRLGRTISLRSQRRTVPAWKKR